MTTAERIDALETALASGELTVRYEDSAVTFRSTAELTQALAYFQAKAAREAGGATTGVVVSVAGFFRD
jgi:hypothetical protein